MSAAREADDLEDDGLRRGGRASVAQPPRDLVRGVALGFLAMVPLLVLYEWGAQSLGAAGGRNTAELLLFQVFEPLGPRAVLARRALLAIGVAVAGVSCLRRHWALGPALLRIPAEGLLAALVIGPALVGLLNLFGDALPPLPLGGGPRTSPELARAAFHLGGGAYEELLFRVAVYGALVFLARQVCQFLGAGARVARAVAESAGLLGQAALFAVMHLAAVLALWGEGGEEFHPAVFTYRVLAGILLGLLFRWRGPGVAAWTHGLFNLALLLGAGPHVFL